MTIREYWIQIENHDWDICPKNINRMNGEEINKTPKEVTLQSPNTGCIRKNVTMFCPVRNALILRRYNKDWKVPEDRKLNPWDINEPDPTDKGTMGTIPGPLIECNVGDTIIIHFRNMDTRWSKKFRERCHSLHPHGIVFDSSYDGAFPLSPPNNNQPLGDEERLWKMVGVEKFKKGDRVPPPIDEESKEYTGTFTYRWETFGWPTTAGVWHYHDHSVEDSNNVRGGAIGPLVIHNLDDPEDVFLSDLPNNSYLDSPVTKLRKLENGVEELKVSCDPPKKALYLQLYHELISTEDDGKKKTYGNLINGRRKLGNTPTIIAGLDTKMRFGLISMNNNAFHTFHLHGHRWVVRGPNGKTSSDIESSIQNKAISPFEDTKIIGPADSFAFTINQGSRMGSRYQNDPKLASGLGEWHMHCHVLHHMHEGMMGSLLVVKKNQVIKLACGFS